MKVFALAWASLALVQANGWKLLALRMDRNANDGQDTTLSIQNLPTPALLMRSRAPWTF